MERLTLTRTNKFDKKSEGMQELKSVLKRSNFDQIRKLKTSQMDQTHDEGYTSKLEILKGRVSFTDGQQGTKTSIGLNRLARIMGMLLNNTKATKVKDNKPKTVEKSLDGKDFFNVDKVKERLKPLENGIPFDVRDFYRGDGFWKMDDALFRSGLPLNERSVAYLKSIGIKKVVSLIPDHKEYPNDCDYDKEHLKELESQGYSAKTIHNNKEEKEMLDKYGICFKVIPFSESTGPTQGQIKQFMDLFEDKENLPVYLHCHAGEDRTGLLGLIYRVEKEGKDFNTAYKEMIKFGHDFFSFNNLDRLAVEYCKQKDEAVGKKVIIQTSINPARTEKLEQQGFTVYKVKTIQLENCDKCCKEYGYSRTPIGVRI